MNKGGPILKNVENLLQKLMRGLPWLILTQLIPMKFGNKIKYQKLLVVSNAIWHLLLKGRIPVVVGDQSLINKTLISVHHSPEHIRQRCQFGHWLRGDDLNWFIIVLVKVMTR